jgi:hypothetical protein
VTEFNAELQSVITRGLSLLRDGQFFVAHECFEDAWRAASGAERTLLHALAQLAATYHQLALGRARAAVRTWDKASRKLASIGALPPAFSREIEIFLKQVGAAPETARFLDVSRLPAPEGWPRPEYLLPFVSVGPGSTGEK